MIRLYDCFEEQVAVVVGGGEGRAQIDSQSWKIKVVWNHVVVACYT